MAGGSTLNPDNAPDRRREGLPRGHDTRALGPGDTSDSGSDIAGESLDVEEEATGSDRDTDRIVGADEAGLGGGLDQAEEAQLGKTDEEIEAEARRSTRRRG